MKIKKRLGRKWNVFLIKSAGEGVIPWVDSAMKLINFYYNSALPSKYSDDYVI